MNALLERFRKKEAAAKKAARPGPPLVLPAGTPLPLPPVVGRALRQVMFRQKWVSLAECVMLLLAVVPALWLAQALADWWFDLPWLVRLILLLADLAVIGYVVRRFAIRPLRKPLTLETAALRVEKAIPDFRTSLISAVELSAGRPGSAQGSLALVQELLARVTARVRATDIAGQVVKTVNVRRWSKWALVSVVAAMGAGALFWPKSCVLVGRILLSAVPLPTRTIVVPVSRDESTVVGADVKLSARVEGVIPRSGVLHVVFANKDRQEIPVSASAGDEAVFSVTMQNVQQSFSYHFVLNDGVGENFSVTAKTAPVLETLKVLQKYPSYTGMAEAVMPAGNLALLAGSRVLIEGRATQPLSQAAVRLEGVNSEVKMETGNPDSQSFHGEFVVPKEGLTGLSLALANTEGVASQENTIYRVELIEDRAPMVELTAPAGERLSVLLTSRPRLAFTVKDDFAVKKLALKYELTRPPPPGGGESVTEEGEIPLPLSKDGSAAHTYAWNLAAQKPALTEGCTVSYWIEAEDNNDVTGPGVGQTPRKTLAVVSQADKRAEMLEILGARAAEIEEISQTQKKVNEDLDSTIRKNTP